MQWEIARSHSPYEPSDTPGSTVRLTPVEWRRVRTLLADLWDWWADGVHLRPQPREDRHTGQIQWETSLAEKLVPSCRPFVLSSAGSLPEPVRTTTLDAHLGDGLFRLASKVHWHLQAEPEETTLPPLRYQSRDQGRVRFRPSGANATYFGVLCHRISGAGWRPNGAFPVRVDARGADFSGTQLEYLQFGDADLSDSSFQDARVIGCSFHAASLTNCSFSGAIIGESGFVFANLDNSYFSGAHLLANRFNGASLTAVSFDDVDWGHQTSYSHGSVTEQYEQVRVPRNDLSGAVGIKELIAQQAAGPSRYIQPSTPAKAGEEPLSSPSGPETA